jgi:hypothetical protein
METSNGRAARVGFNLVLLKSEWRRLDEALNVRAALEQKTVRTAAAAASATTGEEKAIRGTANAQAQADLRNCSDVIASARAAIDGLLRPYKR